MDNEDLLIDEIKRGNEAILDQIYLQNRGVFLRFGKKMVQDNALVEDIYQDAIIAFYENVSAGKITRLKSSIATYILAIGKFMIYRHLRKNKSVVFLEEIDTVEVDQVFHEYVDIITNDSNLEASLEKALAELGEPCHQLIRLFYYEGKSNSEIMAQLHYASTDVVKSKKYRCLKYLKQILRRILPDGG